MTQFGSHLPYPSQYNIVPAQNVVVAQDTTIYIGPGGNDTTGNGTETAPFATLKKAWEFAQTLIIRGEAVLYITFLKGFYNITSHEAFFPSNLYHPQGANIIIQGDPRGVKQNYLYRVNEYWWDYSRYSHYGHTGSVKLWSRGTTADVNVQTLTGTGTTAHGYSGDDVGGYVAITSPFFSAPWGYYDYQNRILSERYSSWHDPDVASNETSAWAGIHEKTVHAYNSLWYEHQPVSTAVTKHGQQFAILGIARIVGASADPYNLHLAFKNANLDPRSLTFLDDGPGRVGGATSSTASLYGVASNMPVNQAYDPIGYYGATYAWSRRSDSAVPTGRNDLDNIAYTAGLNGNGGTDPSVYPTGLSAFNGGSVLHASDDTLLVTSYPVVLYCADANSSNRRTPIHVKGATIRAIRNLFFTDAFAEPSLPNIVDKANARSLDFGLSSSASYIGGVYDNTKNCITLIDSDVQIRHIGINGFSRYESAIQVIRSKLGVYSDHDGWKPESSSGLLAEKQAAHSHTVEARLGSSNNTPVLMVDSRGSTSLYCKDSTVCLTLGGVPSMSGVGGAGRLERYTESYHRTEESVWMQSHAATVIAAENSDLTIGSAILNANCQFPARSIYLFMPLWWGMTGSDSGSGSGNTTGAYSPNLATTTSTTVLYYETPATTAAGTRGVTIGRIGFRGLNGSEEYSSRNSTFIAPTASFFKNLVSDPGPSAGGGSGWRYMQYSVMGVGTEINNLLTLNDWKGTSNSLMTLGYTLAAHSFTNNAETVASETYWKVGKDAVVMKATGATFEVRSTGVGANVFNSIYSTRPEEIGSTLIPGNPVRHSCIALVNSRMNLRKNLVLKGGCHGIAALNGSKFYPLSWANNSSVPSAYVMTEMQTRGAVGAYGNSVVRLPSILTKNPPVVCVPQNGKNPAAGSANQIYATEGSRVEFAGDAILISPTRTVNSAWTTRSGSHLNFGASSTTDSAVPTNLSLTHQRISPIFAENGSDVVCLDITRNLIMLASDGSYYPGSGGTPVAEYKDPDGIFINQTTNSRVGPLFPVPSVRITGVSGSNLAFNSGNAAAPREQGFRVLGYSGPSSTAYLIQSRQTDSTKRFYDLVSTNAMWRFWNHGYGFTTSSAAANTVFYQLPIMTSNAVSPNYGQSSTIAVDGARPASAYGDKILSASHVFPSTGVSYGFVRPPSAGGAITDSTF